MTEEKAIVDGIEIDVSNATDINENHSWKDEVEALNQQIFKLNQEIVANQLMVGVILQETGPVVVSRKAIADGLAGYQIALVDSEDGTTVTFSLESN